MGQVLPIGVVVAVGLLHLHQAGDPQDEGALLVYADRVIHGAVAQRDFLTFYGPGTSWLLGGLFLVTGPSIVAERLLWVGVAAAIVVILTRIARRWGPWQGAVAGALAALSLVQLTSSSLPWLTAIALLLASLAVTTSAAGRARATWTFALAGLLAAFAVTCRIDLTPAVALTAIPLLLKRRRLFLWYATGAVVGLIPLGIHTLVATPGAVFQNVFVDAVLRQSAGRRLPVPPLVSSTAQVFFAVTAAAVVSLAASVVAQRREAGSARTRLLQAVTGLSLGLLPEMFQRADLAHIFYAACVCLAVLPISMTVLTRGVRLRIGPLVAAVTYALGLSGALTAPALSGLPVTNLGREFFTSPADQRDTQAILQDVDRMSRPGQRLFVGPGDMRRTNYTATYLYFLLPDLTPATYFLEMEPLTANRADSHLAAEVASADILVLTTEWDNWNEPNASAQLGSDAPNEVVSRSFCLRTHRGVYRVYTRCSAAG